MVKIFAVCLIDIRMTVRELNRSKKKVCLKWCGFSPSLRDVIIDQREYRMVVKRLLLVDVDS
jgi:hypothetical protein